MAVSFSHRGSFDKMESFLTKAQRIKLRRAVEPIAQKGVDALAAATPTESGLASRSWGYSVREGKDWLQVIWTNNDVEGGFPVVIMLQYGYATGTGGYVQGRDFINPTMKPIFDEISEQIWKVVTSL